MNSQNEKIIETKNCHHCNISFNITDTDLEFYDKVSPIFDGEKFSIPTPKLCPECRQQRRLGFRNERNLYKRKCDATGKNIISMYSPDKKIKVYDQKFWWSDRWNALDYGVDFNFTDTFFNQYKSLLFDVPHKSLINNFETNENSDFANFSGNIKDSYGIFEAGTSQECYYGNSIRRSSNSLDSLGLIFGENCYETIDCNTVSLLFYSKDCKDCSYGYFLNNCTNCTDCFLCFNLINKSYCIFNIQYTKAEYEIKREELLGDFNNLFYIYDDFIKNRVVKSQIGFGNENASGNYLYNSHDIKSCYEVKNTENSKFCTVMSSSKDITKDCYDYDYFGHAEKSYEIITVGDNTYNTLFSVNTWGNVSFVIYSINCKGSSHCFGCFGVTDQQYCIFNKQYTKEEYNILVPKIINHMKNTGEWGEFFPSSLSAFGYNETVAQEYFPLEKDDAIGRDFNWSDYQAPLPKVDKIISAKKLPDDIREIPDDILNWAIECEITKKPFRIIPQELDFYRKHSLPIPKRHPNQRHLDRMKLRNLRKLYKRDCDKCNIEMDTTYAPEREEKVYCEICYDREVY